MAQISANPISHRPAFKAPLTRRIGSWLRGHWVLVLTTLIGFYVGVPWLAPVFMKLGWTGPAGVIYLIYSTQCHQLPERSYFLFGPQAMWSLGEIQLAWQETRNPFLLRQFVGNAEMGWKVAWSDRMASLYGAVFLASLGYGLSRRTGNTMPWWVALILAAPMVIDGGTHFVSDLAGLGQGFRDSNDWLAALTNHGLPTTFYVGDALGSFNSWMRLITGSLFGVAIVGFTYPYLDAAMGIRGDRMQQVQALERQ